MLRPDTARAADPFEACVSAYDQAQVDRRAGKLVSAKERLLTCSQAACPAAARRDCARWLDEVETSIPTVVVEATSGSGAELTEVRVLIDGRLLAPRLEGKALAVDPGTHTFGFETAGVAGVTQTVTIREGEKNRKIQVRLGAPATPEPAPEPVGSRPIPVLAFVLGGVGLVGLGSFAFFGIRAKNDEAELRDSGCQPRCDVDEVDAVFEKQVIADVSLGIGLAALAAATIVFLTRPTVGGRSAATARPLTLRF